jgi:uncharacterized protein (TIGR02246 family)
MMHADEAIRELVARLVAAWNSGDMRAFASLFTTDASYITGQGRWLKGREAIEEEFSTSQGKRSAVTINDTRIKLLTPYVALVHHTWEMAGSTNQEAGGAPLRSGIITQVLIREGERWLIAALQNTDREALQRDS